MIHVCADDGTCRESYVVADSLLAAYSLAADELARLQASAADGVATISAAVYDSACAPNARTS